MKHILLISACLTSIGFTASAQSRDAIFAGGCFWCIEKDFESVKGVSEVVSGYTGGKTKNPTYKTIGSHLEAVKITYDPDIVSYETLVSKFFRSIDPTDAGGQFCDRGNAYTTAIFAMTDQERKIAQAEIDKITNSGKLQKPIVTPIHTASTFYDAEGFHQDYYKSKQIVLTRFGPTSKSEAYKKYRKACGRDARVKSLWGSDAAFLN